MRVRHRIPSIFSLSMVDVLCCALGCIILLWLLNAKQLDDETARQAHRAEDLIAQARVEREESQARLSQLEADRASQDSLLRTARSERDAARTLMSDLATELRTLKAARSALERQLAEQERMARMLRGELATSSGRLALLEGDLKKRAADLEREKGRAGVLGREVKELEALVGALRREVETARSKHTAAETRAQGLEKDLARMQKDLPGLTRSVEELQGARAGLEKALAQEKERRTSAEGKAGGLEKQVTESEAALKRARNLVATLESENKTLQGVIARTRAVAESRFAGIELTGRRVIFLVDTSGSMELVDENTPSPEKWVEVRKTVARLMRSLPELEKYQVITFAAKPSYPLGKEGGWLEHDLKSSPELVLKTLAAMKPHGGTNMYDAFKAAFQYRASGLDTIYLLSDGLPNQGEGLPPGSKGLSELDRGLLLAKHIRKTLQKDWNAARAKQAKVRINTIGFFYESPDLGSFLWALAREHEGSFVGMSKP
jgi:hypothetical protein